MATFQKILEKNSITQGKNSKLKTKTQGFGKVNKQFAKIGYKKAWLTKEDLTLGNFHRFSDIEGIVSRK